MVFLVIWWSKATANPLVKQTLKQENRFVAKLSDFNNHQAEKAFINIHFYIESRLLPDLEDNSFYHHELISAKVIVVTAQQSKTTENTGHHIGHVKAIYDFGAGPLMEMLTHGGQELLIPFNKDNIITINTHPKEIYILETTLTLFC